MNHYLKFFIDGAWVDPFVPKALDVIDPAAEEPCAQISMGSAADADKAVIAALRLRWTITTGHSVFFRRLPRYISSNEVTS